MAHLANLAPPTVAMLILAASCTGGSSLAPTRTPSIQPTAPFSSPSPSPTPTFTDADRSAVEQTVRDFLQAFVEQDPAKSESGRQKLSIGDLKSWMGWQLQITYPGSSPMGDLTVNSLRVAGFDGHTATVDLDAEAKYNNGTDYRLSGPVLVEKTNKGWKLSDYKRDGRDQKQAVFTAPRGGTDRSGVALEVIGVVLQADYIDVFVSLTNRTSDKVQFNSGVSLVDQQGRQITDGTIGNGSVEVASHAYTTTEMYWDGKSLPIKSRTFRLVGSFDLEPSFNSVDFDFVVRLGG